MFWKMNASKAFGLGLAGGPPVRMLVGTTAVDAQLHPWDLRQCSQSRPKSLTTSMPLPAGGFRTYVWPWVWGLELHERSKSRDWFVPVGAVAHDHGFLLALQPASLNDCAPGLLAVDRAAIGLAVVLEHKQAPVVIANKQRLGRLGRGET